MHRYTLLIVFFMSQMLLCPLGAESLNMSAEDNSQSSQPVAANDTVASNTKRGFWEKGLGRFLKKADNKLKEWEAAGIDTNYVRVPERDRYVYLGGYGYYQHHNMEFPILVHTIDYPEFIRPYIPSNIDEKSYMNTRVHTFQTEMELGIDWRGVTIELPITITNKYSKSFGLAKNGNAWGLRLRYKQLDKMNGTLDDAYNQVTEAMVDRMLEDDIIDEEHGDNSPVETSTRKIGKDELDLRTFYAEAYYVFNHTKFSLSAGMYGDMVQKKPAGSLFVMANYYQSDMKCNNLLNYEHDKFRTSRVSLGAGYGYNLPFFDGRLCFHASIIPMLSVMNRVSHSGWSSAEEGDDDPLSEEIDALFESYDMHYYDACKYGRDSAFRVNLFGRFAVNYSFNRYIISLLANYRRYLFGASSGLKVADRELDVQLNVGWRF